MNINKLMETWPEWRRKIMMLAKMEAVHRPFIKKLLNIIDEEDKDLNCPDGMYVCTHSLYKYNFFFADHKDVVCLEILLRLFFPRGVQKDVIFIKKFEVSTV